MRAGGGGDCLGITGTSIVFFCGCLCLRTPGGSKRQAPDFRCFTLCIAFAPDLGGGIAGYPPVSAHAVRPRLSLPIVRGGGGGICHGCRGKLADVCTKRGGSKSQAPDIRCLTFRPAARGGENARTHRFRRQARSGFGPPGGGPKSQAPDIRCLTVRPAAGAVKPRGRSGSLGKHAPVSRLRAAGPKVKHRISGA